ncbi:MAG: hypothetical protein Q8Q22_00160 [bacterium]|nr:hypothetical protein [bacterium]MDZ4205661.1 hypothetical protein [Patescibacteria group bacterium]
MLYFKQTTYREENDMCLRVIVFIFGEAAVIFGIYTTVEPIGRIMAAIGGLSLAVAGVFLCTFAVLDDRFSNKTNY